jgi:hypothetical protein
MRRALLLTTIFLFGTFVFPQAPSPKAASVFDQQVIDQQKRFLQAVANKNTAEVDRAIADDFQGVEKNGDLYDKDGLVESLQTGMPKDARTYDFHVVELNDNSAIVAYNLIVPGEHPRYRRMADTWAKIDGQWKLKFRQMTPNLWSAADLD